MNGAYFWMVFKIISIRAGEKDRDREGTSEQEIERASEREREETRTQISALVYIHTLTYVE